MIRIFRGQEVVEPDIDDIVSLSEKVYPQKFVIPARVLKSWHEINPDIFLVARDAAANNRIAGYLISVPLSASAYERTFFDDFEEKDIALADILKYDVKGAYFLHFCSIVINPLYVSSKTVYRRILGGYIDLLFQLLLKDIFIAEASAHVVSEGGEKLCSFLRMRSAKTFADDTKIFTVSAVPEVARFLSAKGKIVVEEYGRMNKSLVDCGGGR